MKTTFNRRIIYVSILAALLLAAFSAPSSATAAVPASWTGDPDPYWCNFYLDCFWTIKVCINGVIHEVGIYYDPDTATNAEMEADAARYGTVLTVGRCTYVYTGRWVHSYAGKSWTCNLVSNQADKNAARFSDLSYVKQVCGEHELFGPYDGTADYTLCREKSGDGKLFCGNKYDTSY